MTNLQQNPDEIWMQVIGYESFYLVSNLGNIKSLDRISNSKNNYSAIKTGKILKQRTSFGYKRVCLMKNGIKKYYQLHRLIALAFLPNPENKPQVNHKNGVKNDNRLINLEWCTGSENTLHAFSTGLSKPSMSGLGKINNSSSKRIKQFSLTGEFIAEYSSLAQAQRDTGISLKTISGCVTGKYSRAKNFKWQYA